MLSEVHRLHSVEKIEKVMYGEWKRILKDALIRLQGKIATLEIYNSLSVDERLNIYKYT
jgi:hypothetical protein